MEPQMRRRRLGIGAVLVWIVAPILALTMLALAIFTDAVGAVILLGILLTLMMMAVLIHGPQIDRPGPNVHRWYHRPQR